MRVPSIGSILRAALALAPVLAAGPGFAGSPDCDRDGIDDAQEIALGEPDCDGNGVPDACDLAPSRVEYAIPESMPFERGFLILAAGDLDGDGLPDVVGGSRSFAYLVAAFRKGPGDLQPLAYVDLRWIPRAGRLADLDGDGDPDIVTCGASGTSGNVDLVRNAGSGAFGPVESWTAGADPVSLALADLDGDGDLDAAIVHKAGGKVSILRNAGSGALEAAGSQEVAASPEWIEAGDLDADGKTDLAVAAEAGKVSVLFGEGTGLFSTVPAINVPTPPHFIALRDLDGDGDPDLAVPGHELTVIVNRGGRTFAVLPEASPAALLAGLDVDGDGDIDLSGGVNPPASKRIVAWLEAGAAPDGALPLFLPVWPERKAPVAADMDRDGSVDQVTIRGILYGDGGRRYRGKGYFSAGGSAGRAAAADLDGDGREDLAVVHAGPDGLSLIIGAGDALPPPAEERTAGISPLAVVPADLDGDGRPDLAVTNRGSPHLSVFRGGSLAAGELPLGRGQSGAAAADLDGDGDLDLAVGAGETAKGAGDAALLILENRGGAGFAPARPVTGGDYEQVGAADLDADGREDLVFTGVGAVRWAMNGGDLEFSVRELWGQSAPFVTGDLDGDGLADLLFNASFDPYISLNDGGGHLRYPTPLPLPVSSSQHVLSICDIDGDGIADLIGYQPSDLLALPNAGRAVFPRGITIELQQSSQTAIGMVTADIDGDGARDLGLLLDETYLNGTVLRNRSTGPRAADRNGNGVPDPCDIASGAAPDCNRNGIPDPHDLGAGFAFSPPEICHVPWNWSSFLVRGADFDGDADIDLAILDSNSNELFIDRNRGDGGFEATPHQFFTFSWDNAAVTGDLDGDGDQDILLQSWNGNVLWNDGTGIFRQVQLPGVDKIPIIGEPLADLDRDGDLDAMRLDGRQVQVLLNDGRGILFPGPAAAVPADFARAADLDLDGTPDLAIAGLTSRELTLHALENKRLVQKGFADLGCTPRTILLADLDGDERPDVIEGRPALFGIGLFLNRGGFAFEEAGVIDRNRGTASSLLLASDLDLDGRRDIVLPGALYRGLPEGRYGMMSFPDFKLALAADLDGDGDEDIVHGGSTWLRALQNRAWIRSFDRDRDGIPDECQADCDGDGVPDALALRRGEPDCDGNGTPDACDLAEGDLVDGTNGPPDGIPDECQEPWFHRGDPDDSGRIDLSDAVSVLGFLFLGEAAPACAEAADANDDGKIDLSDPVGLLGFLFLGGSPPADPGPVGAPCGPDPEGSPARLGCSAYTRC